MPNVNPKQRKMTSLKQWDCYRIYFGIPQRVKTPFCRYLLTVEAVALHNGNNSTHWVQWSTTSTNCVFPTELRGYDGSIRSTSSISHGSVTTVCWTVVTEPAVFLVSGLYFWLDMLSNISPHFWQLPESFAGFYIIWNVCSKDYRGMPAGIQSEVNLVHTPGTGHLSPDLRFSGKPCPPRWQNQSASYSFLVYWMVPLSFQTSPSVRGKGTYFCLVPGRLE